VYGRTFTGQNVIAYVKYNLNGQLHAMRYRPAFFQALS
jgi:hypothetical protein